MKNALLIFFTLVLLIGLEACKKDDPWTNPFDDPGLQPPAEDSTDFTASPTSIVGLHHNIFSKTCANSGCHDGAFEPDFRTIEGTYNTLVYQPVIKNDPNGTYEFRVKPGDATNSVLYQRLMIDIDGQSGIMPLSVDPGSDWEANKTEYINNIRDWINNGAQDIFGNNPSEGDFKPQLSGMVGFAAGNTNALPRKPGKGPIRVAAGTSSLDLWFAIVDQETPTPDLTYNKVKLSTRLNEFEGEVEQTLQIVSPIAETGYLGDPVDHYHKITVDPSQYPVGTTVFVRVYVQDAGTGLTELPNFGSVPYIKEYAAFVIE